MESAYLKLVSGSRLGGYVGLTMDEGAAYRYAKNYLYVEIPVASVSGSEDGLQVKRNQHVFIGPACTVDVKGNHILEVEPNPELAEYGQVQASYKIHPGTGKKRPGFWFTARKDIDLSTLEFAVRLYLYS